MNVGNNARLLERFLTASSTHVMLSELAMLAMNVTVTLTRASSFLTVLSWDQSVSFRYSHVRLD